MRYAISEPYLFADVLKFKDIIGLTDLCSIYIKGLLLCPKLCNHAWYNSSDIP